MNIRTSILSLIATVPWLVLILLPLDDGISAFVFPTSRCRFCSPSTGWISSEQQHDVRNGIFLAKKDHSEYSVYEDDDDEEDEAEEDDFLDFTEASTITTTTTTTTTDPKESQQQQRTSSIQFEYAALPPGGAAVQIQIGDISLARKAWKKRRRSGSPLLVPCSILNINLINMLQHNAQYILYKFGNAQKDGIVLSVTDLIKRHKQHLKSPLMVSFVWMYE